MGNKRLRPGEEVLVIAGNNRGKIGKIISRSEERVIVEGVNVRKKHRKPTAQGQKGQIIDIECSIHISNVKSCVDGEAVKLRSRVNAAGERELFYKKDDREVLYRPIKKAKG